MNYFATKTTFTHFDRTIAGGEEIKWREMITFNVGDILRVSTYRQIVSSSGRPEYRQFLTSMEVIATTEEVVTVQDLDYKHMSPVYVGAGPAERIAPWARNQTFKLAAESSLVKRGSLGLGLALRFSCEEIENFGGRYIRQGDILAERGVQIA